jgi:hypothetical protein
VNQTPEFLEGPIARDYREILESAPSLEAATKSSTGKDCSQPAVCPKPNTGKNCSEPNVCPKAETGKDCSRPHICKKANAEAFHPSVPGWSLPPAPPPA